MSVPGPFGVGGWVCPKGLACIEGVVISSGGKGLVCRWGVGGGDVGGYPHPCY